mgnify:CR=1 FL=1
MYKLPLVTEQAPSTPPNSGCLTSGEKCDGEGSGCDKCKTGTPCCSGEYIGCGAFQTPTCK